LFYSCFGFVADRSCEKYSPKINYSLVFYIVFLL